MKYQYQLEKFHRFLGRILIFKLIDMSGGLIQNLGDTIKKYFAARFEFK